MLLSPADCVVAVDEPKTAVVNVGEVAKTNAPLPCSSVTIADISEEVSIRAWLDGKTLAPRDHKVFDLLKRTYGSGFDHFLSHPHDNSGFYKNYRIYVFLRQAIMKKLNSWKLEGGSEEDDIEREKRKITEVAREVNLICSEFLKDITDNLKSVRVVDIEAKRGENEPPRSSPYRLLGQGIVRGAIDEFRGNMTQYSHIYEEMEILKEFLDDVVTQINSPYKVDEMFKEDT